MYIDMTHDSEKDSKLFSILYEMIELFVFLNNIYKTSLNKGKSNNTLRVS